MTTTTNTRTITAQSRRGPKTVQTPYTDDQVCVRLQQLVGDGALSSDFALSLADRINRGWRMSDKQMAWVHILVVEAETPRTTDKPAAPKINASSIIDACDAAHAKGIKFPKLRIPNGDGRVVFGRSGDQSKRPGVVNITDGGSYGDNVWFGRIERDGTVVESRAMTDDVRAIIEAVAADPRDAGRVHGRRTGNCCFCGRDLTTKESVTAGYGPKCASNWGLPWGDTDGYDEATADAQVIDVPATVHVIDASDVVVQPIPAPIADDACERCGTPTPESKGGLFHNDATGLAVCGKCDTDIEAGDTDTSDADSGGDWAF